MASKTFSTDWLGSNPVFYNTKTGAVSHSFNDVVDWNDVTFDPEGFNNYLDYGYSVFGQTPVKDVRFLRHSSELIQHDDGRLEIIEGEDPVDGLLEKKTQAADVLALIEKKVQDWEMQEQGEIVIPTSGGYDSRLLNLCIKDPKQIRSFTYGTSPEQDESTEVVYARALARVLGTQWEQIPLGDYHRHLDEWDDIFGASVHAHGMYHLEFYEKVQEKVHSKARLLSGIIGDAWAGSVIIDPIEDTEGLKRLGYTHNMHADSAYSLLPKSDALQAAYLERNREKLCDPHHLVIEAMRFKMILLSYLLRVPEHFGFRPWSPFLDMEVALAMLNLPDTERAGRKWQTEYFTKHGVDFESRGLKKDARNTLLLETLQHTTLPLLDASRFAGLIKRDYVEHINRILAQSKKTLARKFKIHSFLLSFYHIPYLEKLAHRLRIDTYHLNNAESRAYSAYLTLKPIENLIKRRDEHHT